MGKPSRKLKDIFFRRAKRAGYRSRAAFKLTQLNKKYDFFSSARVCIDLCASPGSWMQVASKLMPVSSVIIGVDRYRIAPIPNTICLRGDIMTEKTRQDLKANLKTWKADVVLHDGSPHVGQNWLQDSYGQNLLVLHAFKLACEFLIKGGSFVTKVFRSKDHMCLQYVCRKLFKNVETTKPTASRLVSAEAYIVCQGFLAPDKIDPKFFDPKYVFQSLESEPSNKTSIQQPEKTKRKAEGYEEGITMLFKKKNISEFIESSNYIGILEEANKLEWDLPEAQESIHTTEEIIELCKDIKVLGRKDLRLLINWRKAVKDELEELQNCKSTESSVQNYEEENKETQKEMESTKEEKEKDEAEEDLEELQQIQEEVMKLKEEKKKEDKQLRKKTEKKMKRIEEKLKLQLMVPGDPGPQESQCHGLFSLATLNEVKTLDNIVDQSADILAQSDAESDEEPAARKRFEYYKKGETYLDKTGTFHKTADETSSESEIEEDSDEEGLMMEKEEEKQLKKLKKVTFAEDKADSDKEPDDDTKNVNPLLTDLVGNNVPERRERKAETWFSRVVFGELESEDVEDFELESAIQKHKDLGGKIKQKRSRAKDKVVTDQMKSEDVENKIPTQEDLVNEILQKTRSAIDGVLYDPIEWEDVEDFEEESILQKHEDLGGKILPETSRAKDEETASVTSDQKGTERKLEDFSAQDAPHSGSDSDSDSDSEDTEQEQNYQETKPKKKKGPILNNEGLALATMIIRSKKAQRDIYDAGWNRYMFGEEDLPEWFAADEKLHNFPRIEVDKEDLVVYQNRNKAVDARTIKKVMEAKARKLRRMRKRMNKVRKQAEIISRDAEMSAREKAMEINKVYKKAVAASRPKGMAYFVMKKQYAGKKPKGARGKMVDGRLKKDKRAAERIQKGKEKNQKFNKLFPNVFKKKKVQRKKKGRK